MRPKVICRMVSSVDGRLLVERWTPPVAGVSSNIVGEVYENLASRLSAQGWRVCRRARSPWPRGNHA